MIRTRFGTPVRFTAVTVQKNHLYVKAQLAEGPPVLRDRWIPIAEFISEFTADGGPGEIVEAALALAPK